MQFLQQVVILNEMIQRQCHTTHTIEKKKCRQKYELYVHACETPTCSDASAADAGPPECSCLLVGFRRDMQLRLLLTCSDNKTSFFKSASLSLLISTYFYVDRLYLSVYLSIYISHNDDLDQHRRRSSIRRMARRPQRTPLVADTHAHFTVFESCTAQRAGLKKKHKIRTCNSATQSLVLESSQH